MLAVKLNTLTLEQSFYYHLHYSYYCFNMIDYYYYFYRKAIITYLMKH